MRIALYILSITLLSACTKEDKITIPIHPDSFSWVIGNETRYYVNTVGDSVSTDTIDSGHGSIIKFDNGISDSGASDSRSPA